MPSLWTSTDVVPGLGAREERAPVLRVRRKIPTFLLSIGKRTAEAIVKDKARIRSVSRSGIPLRLAKYTV